MGWPTRALQKRTKEGGEEALGVFAHFSPMLGSEAVHESPAEGHLRPPNFATDQLSTQVRTLVLGILALVWAFLSGNKDVMPLKHGASKEPLMLIGAICILTVVLDLLQYMCLYVSANQVRQRAEAANDDIAEYDERGGTRRLGAAAWLLILNVVTVW